MIKTFCSKLISLAANRIVMLFAIIVVLFSMLLVRLYDLQIIQQKQHQEAIRATTMRTLSIPAQRGDIYDRFGRPLAVSKTSFSVKMDLSVSVSLLNEVLDDVLKLFQANGEEYLDELPITKSEPFEFVFSSLAAENRWKKDMGLKEEQLDITASEMIDYLRKYFDISPGFSVSEARDLIALRSEIYMQRYRQYHSITLAHDVSLQTISVIEEQYNRFPGIYIDVYANRYYPEGEDMSHILGYIGAINKNELAKFESYGYTNTDPIGKVGIEKAYEHILSGTKGEVIIEVDPRGRRVNSVETIVPTKGENVYLTLDSKLQKKASQVLRENLKIVLVQKLDSGEITSDQLFQSLAQSSMISVKKIMESEEDLVQNNFKYLILDKLPHFNVQNLEDVVQAKKVLSHAITVSTIRPLQIVLCLIEQNAITCNEEILVQLQNGQISPHRFIRDKIASDEINPSDTNLDPCTGSIAVVDVHSGDVLALVSYPSYDNNKLVNYFDNTYYQKLLNDPTRPLINRALMERKAPGSILKMITAIAGMESGIINSNSKIEDQGIYQKAGFPHAKCLIYSRYGITHGAINVSKALEVSCNYFFYEIAYRMGNELEGTTLNAIATLNEYMKKFGLGDYSGIEIEELKPNLASTDTKKIAVESFNKDAPASQTRWMDGDSIRCAIGQSYNSFSVMHIAKYIATLANGKVRYKINLIKGTKSSEAIKMKAISATVEEELHISPETLQTVHEGMLGVTTGSQGNLRHFFQDFPIQVAAKTGTAEEARSRPSHTWFAGFAPYDHPQIAVVIMIPFGETSSAPATLIAKEIIAEYLGLQKKPDSKFVNANTFMN